MKVFDPKTFDIRTASNETISALADTLILLLSDRDSEQQELDRKYAGAFERLSDSLNPEQQKLFDIYRDYVDEEYHLSQQHQFICGFKTAMRLALESMK